MSELVGKLTSGEHPVEAVRYDSAPEFVEAVKSGLVVVRFPETQGGTELSIRLADDAIENGGNENEDIMRFSGTLTLDYVPLACTLTIDRGTLKGVGVLERSE